MLIPTPVTFALDGTRVYETLYEHTDEPLEVHRRLAYWLQSFHAEFGAQVVLLGVALGVS